MPLSYFSCQGIAEPARNGLCQSHELTYWTASFVLCTTKSFFFYLFFFFLFLSFCCCCCCCCLLRPLWAGHIRCCVGNGGLSRGSTAASVHCLQVCSWWRRRKQCQKLTAASSVSSAMAEGLYIRRPVVRALQVLQRCVFKRWSWSVPSVLK